MDSATLKKTIRKALLEKRSLLSKDVVQAHSRQIFEKWCNRFSVKKATYVHIFQPILANNEVQTQFIMDFLRRKHPQVRIVVPVVDSVNKILRHAYITDDIELIPNRWGIPEPKVPTQLIYPMEIDMVLVPMLGFDSQGQRIGYGGGYYDKFLALTRPECAKIGLCFELGRLTETIPSEPHDIPLDFVVTENEIIRFNPNFQI